MAQFSGNEFVIALNLFVWLAAAALGTRLALIGMPKDPLRLSRCFALTGLGMAVLPVLTLLFVRWLRLHLFLFGSSVGFYPTLGFIVMTVAPYSLVTGYLVPRGLSVLRTVQPQATAARAYVMDNVGNVAGGAFFSFLLVWWTRPIVALCLAGLPLVAAAAVLLKVCDTRRWMPPLAVAMVGLALAAGLMVETASLGSPHGRLIHYEETRYGRLAIFQNQGETTLFRDGRPAITSYDPAGAEAAVHYPLAIVEQPASVLLIGGSGAMLSELDKYRLETVDYVEIDPMAARLQIDFGLMRRSEAVNFLHQDGRAYLAGTQERYDAILIALPEPETFQLNRFFSEQFFRLAADHLRSGGVLSFSVQGYADYIAPVQARKLSILQQTAAQHFRHVRALPGAQVFFLCRQEPIPLDLPERLDAKGIETLYAGPYYYGEIDPMRLAELDAALDPNAPGNSDFSPRLVRVMLDAWFAKFATSPALFAVAVMALGLFYLWRLGSSEYILWTTGAMVMGSEILVIFAFQIAYGYIYHQLGLIVTAFLAGLLPGVLLASRYPGDVRRILICADIAMILLLTFLAPMLVWGGQRWPAGVFVLFGLVLSMAAGFQFPAAVRWRGGDLAAAAGAFGADLAGAAAGLLMVSVVLIPYLGLFGAIVGLVLMKISSLAVAGRCR